VSDLTRCEQPRSGERARPSDKRTDASCSQFDSSTLKPLGNGNASMRMSARTRPSRSANTSSQTSQIGRTTTRSRRHLHVCSMTSRRRTRSAQSPIHLPPLLQKRRIEHHRKPNTLGRRARPVPAAKPLLTALPAPPRAGILEPTGQRSQAVARCSTGRSDGACAKHERCSIQNPASRGIRLIPGWPRHHSPL
jgi:hypothetical protein